MKLVDDIIADLPNWAIYNDAYSSRLVKTCANGDRLAIETNMGELTLEIEHSVSPGKHITKIPLDKNEKARILKVVHKLVKKDKKGKADKARDMAHKLLKGEKDE